MATLEPHEKVIGVRITLISIAAMLIIFLFADWYVTRNIHEGNMQIDRKEAIQ